MSASHALQAQAQITFLPKHQLALHVAVDRTRVPKVPTALNALRVRTATQGGHHVLCVQRARSLHWQAVAVACFAPLNMVLDIRRAKVQQNVRFVGQITCGLRRAKMMRTTVSSVVVLQVHSWGRLVHASKPPFKP
jgi:hypothetical protein